VNSRQSPHEQAKGTNAHLPVKQDSAQLAKRGLWASLRETGERITGGGIRALGKLLFVKFVRRLMAMVMRRPRLMAFIYALLKPFPRVTWQFNRLAAFASRIYIPSGRLSKYVDAITMTLPASARMVYLKLRAATSDNGSWNRL
jgi:hypothetical protein